MVVVICGNCGKQFESYPSHTRKFCSQRCANLRKKILQAHICKYCGKKFTCNVHVQRTFCSRECAYSWRTRCKRNVICEQCGKEFVARHSGKNKFCSVECKCTASRKYRKELICEFCRKVFLRNSHKENRFCSLVCYYSYLRKNEATFLCINCGSRKTNVKGKANKFCSQKCCFEYIRNQRIKSTCIECGKEFNIRKGHANLFCSRYCYGVNQSKSEDLKVAQSKRSLENWQRSDFVQKQMKSRRVWPNKSENKLMYLLDEIFPGKFRFVGEGSLIIGGKCPDYVDNTNKYIIELFGEYWHTEEETIPRMVFFNSRGYNTVIIWYNELKNVKKLTNKLKNIFAGVI